MLLSLLAAMAAGQAAPATPAQAAPSEAAARFGMMEGVLNISLSPDGRRVAYIGPGPGAATIVSVIDTADGSVKEIAQADGISARIRWCDWSAADRLVCQQYGITEINATPVSFARLTAIDADGANLRLLERHSGRDRLRASQYDGDVVDWLAGDDGTILMMRDNVPEKQTGTLLASSANGLSLERVDTRTGRGATIEAAARRVVGYVTDGRGVARIRAMAGESNTGLLEGYLDYSYRTADSREWKPFGRVTFDGAGLRPIAVDGGANAAYAIRRENGRDALFRIALDGSMKTELVFARPDVDVDGVITIGRHGRVIGARYTTDHTEAVYFDPEYKRLAEALSRALPKAPLVRFESASADEGKLVIFAGSDVDPGRYYLYDRKTHQMGELLPIRPYLDKVRLATVKPVTYPAADGTPIPAYLTLPPDAPAGARLPAIVMPHGGPAARDQWGFDWLAQYFANRGFAVLQPNFRGSSGYGDQWFMTNGFKSWRTAIGDVVDGGRWLKAQGIADPAKLAIFGWSYGGYAALQANILDPDLFKAVVAVAPVTDLDMIKAQAMHFTNSRLVADFVGSGPHVAEGSPLRHADAFKAPVMLFHGTRDLNVGVEESRAMDAALHRAGKASELVTYDGLDHGLPSSRARADMLMRSDAFLRRALNLPETAAN